jgi:hypothetical protein
MSVVVLVIDVFVGAVDLVEVCLKGIETAAIEAGSI